MRERLVEKHLVDKTHDLGGEAYKFVSPNHRNVPDRLVLLPVNKRHRAIVARYVKFVEVKATGKKPSVMQRREIERLRALGYSADYGASVMDMDLMLTTEPSK